MFTNNGLPTSEKGSTSTSSMRGDDIILSIFKHLRRYRAWTTIGLLITLLTHPVMAEQSPGDVLKTIVGLQATIRDDARTAASLGTNRQGSGVIIDKDGLILTIGYLILEATSVTVTTHEGLAVNAEIVAYDHNTGFGLVRADRPLGIDPIELGDSSTLQVGDPVYAIGSDGMESIGPARVVSRRTFPGYWEYLLEDAIFTSPPYRYFSGSALLGSEGRLMGIGSLIVQDAFIGDDTLPGNMFVPINALKPILKALVTTGRDPKPRRPWVGLYTEEYRGHVVITRIAQDSPAMRAKLKPNDIILKVAETAVSDMAGFFRAMWALGDAGVEVPLVVLRGSEILNITIVSTDRYKWLEIVPQRFTALLHSSAFIMFSETIDGL